MPDDLTKEAADKSTADAKYAIAGTRATIPVMRKTMQDIIDQASEVVRMLEAWAAENSELMSTEIPTEETRTDG